MARHTNTVESGAPTGVPAIDRAALVSEFAGIVNASPLITLATVTPHGWPLAACMHFSLNMDGVRPIIYMFTNEGTRKLPNIAAEPRIALGVFAFGEGGERLAARLQGLCYPVTSGDEHAAAIAEHSRRPGYEHTRFLTMQYQPALRVEVVRATLLGADTARDVEFPQAAGRQDR